MRRLTVFLPVLLAAACASRPGGAVPAGTIRGTVVFEGPPPSPRTIAIPEECRFEGMASEIPEEAVVVNPNGTLRNVLVYLRRGPATGGEEPPEGRARMEMSEMKFIPRVLGVRVGQPVSFVNRDPVFHNVHGRTNAGDAFNFGIPRPGYETDMVFERPEVVVPIVSDVYLWMRAFVGVFAHPCFQVTGEEGTFAFESLPPGEYEVEAWHEALGSRSQT